MNILITGGAGFVGTTLTQQLLDRGARVRCLDTLTYGIEPVLPFFRNARYELVQGDVRDHRTVRECLRDVDTIVHLAAIVGYPACKSDPVTAQQVNVTGTRVLDAMRSAEQRLVFAGTGSSYGAVESGTCEETTTLNPLTVYGRTKAIAEQVLLDRGNVVCFRFATAFGLSHRLRLDLLVNDFCYQAIHKRRLVLYEAHFRRTFIHVSDMARAFLHALDNYDAMRDLTFNCGDPSLNASKLDIAEMIANQTDLHVDVAEIGKDEDQRNYEMSYTRLLETGFRVAVTLEDGVAEMLRAFRHLRVGLTSTTTFSNGPTARAA